jgi:iron complex outermembrane receptor protein
MGTERLLHVGSVVWLAWGALMVAAPIANALNATTDQSESLSEIVVTAEKREERLQDVPVPVTAINADTLLENNQLRLQDYFSSVPGLSFTTAGSGQSNLAIRGLNSGGNPTVAVLVDDVSVSSASNLSGIAGFVPDLDPSDLARVEVLRGPQGTLYGASSLGGLVKYVTADPSTDKVTGRIQVDTNSVQNGDGLGYGVRGAVNVPITDTLAIRVSGFTRKDPGYIDNPSLDFKGVNEDHAEGGHLSALWRPSEFFSVKLGALIQDTVSDGASVSQAGLRDQQNFTAGTGEWDLRVHLYSATLKAKLGGMDITSVTGYSINQVRQVGDFSTALGVPGIALPTVGENDKFSQEVRLSSSIGTTVDWLLGAYYGSERSPVQQQLFQLNVPGAAFPVGELFDASFPSTFAEYAAFADFTVHFTDRFDVQLGGRESRNHQVFNQTTTINPTVVPIFGPTTVSPTEYSNDSSFTYLVTPRFKISPDLMVYARLASGYRPGGPNQVPSGFNIPLQFGPDSTKNYELGIKGEVFDHKITFDGSVYYINWKNIQTTIEDVYTFYTNASSAKSQGVELSAQARPIDGLTIDGWVAWDDAKLTADFPATSTAIGMAGDRLPYTSRYSANLSVEQEFPLGARATGFVRGSAIYVGQREGYFSAAGSTVPRLSLGGYVQPNILAGVRYDAWSVNAFVNNVSDKRGVISDFAYVVTSEYYAYIQPRTVGLSLSYKF